MLMGSEEFCDFLIQVLELTPERVHNNQSLAEINGKNPNEGYNDFNTFQKITNTTPFPIYKKDSFVVR